MKKQIYLLWLLAVMASLQVFGAKKADPVSEGRTRKNFTAVASNVDGLPPNVHIDVNVVFTHIVKDIEMNPDGSQEPGAMRMGQLFADRLWDIVALSEDFNYHNYIMDGVKNYYNASTYRGIIDQSNVPNIANYLSKTAYVDTDGLCLLTRKTSKVLEEKIVRWNDHYGYDEEGENQHEADGLIDKGYRFYQICLEGNLIVDVYIMHMDAGSTTPDGDRGDLDARTSQLKQLCKAILASKNGNPIIILGDTNCRYTRDTVMEDLINPINSDPRFEIRDPWVDMMWDGNYPAYRDIDDGATSIMTSQWGQQKGEVVDKVWFINNTDSDCHLMYTYGKASDACNYEYAVESETCSYLHDDQFTYADGGQIADHFPVVAYLTIEGPATPPPPPYEIPVTEPEKKAVVSGTTYYLRNLGSGEFVRAGGAWTTQAVMGDYPSKFTLTSKGGNKWTLKSTHDNKWLGCNGSDYYVDKDENEWSLTQVDKNVYTLVDASNNAVGYNNGILAPVTSNTSDVNQQWEFLTENDLRYELYLTNSDSPKDVTFLMKAPDFGLVDKENWGGSPGSYAKYESGNDNRRVEGGRIRYGDINNVSFYKIYNDKRTFKTGNDWTLSQTISGLPAGTYKVTYQCLTYNLPKDGNHKFTINGVAALWTDVSDDPGSETVAQNLAAGQYAYEAIVEVKDDGTYKNQININVNKEATTAATGAYYDNFKIKCIGIEGKYDKTVYSRVQSAINDAYEKAGELGIPLNNRGVETLCNNHEIVGDGWNEVKRTYKNLAEAVLTRTEIPFDYTYTIVNPSFELYPEYKDSRYQNMKGGYPFGWTYPNKIADDSGVWNKSNADKATAGVHEDYLFNTYENGMGGNPLCQEVTLTPGIYELKVNVASDNGNTVYIFAGDTRAAKIITGNKDTFEEAELHFAVTEALPLNIGITGADASGNFTMDGGKWYKADNFRLTRIGAQETIKGMELLELAIKDVKAKATKYGATPDLSKYEAMLANYTLTGDGKKEFYEVYEKLKDIIFAKYDASTADITCTDLIPNNSFEWGDLYCWDVAWVNDETKVVDKTERNGDYNFTSVDGNYLFNTWSGEANGYKGANISQTIPYLPAGSYVLYATFANGANDPTFLQISGGEMDVQREIFMSTSDATVGEVRQLEFFIDQETPITITAGGCIKLANGTPYWSEDGGYWYKVDNFRLIRKADNDVCVFYRKLKAAIDDANKIVADLPEEYRTKWSAYNYEYLYEKHMEGGANHDPSSDPGNMAEDHGGLILELYRNLRNLILEQKEANANLTGVITNHSFETGDLTGWTVVMPGGADFRVENGIPAEDNPTFGTVGLDGDYIYNCYYQWPDHKGRPLTQVIPNLPAGIYTLKVKIASYNGYKFVLAANDQHSDIYEFQGKQEKAEAEFNDYELQFEVPNTVESQDVKIGLYPTFKTNAVDLTEEDFADDVDGPWFKADDFRLILNSRYLVVDWKMETPTHGTIMLPFDVSAEELADKQLEAYTITVSDPSNTPADKSVNNYRIMNYEGPHAGLKANVPYILKNVGTIPTPETKQIKTAGSDNLTLAPDDPQNAYTGKIYRFIGYSSYAGSEIKQGNLTGTLVDRTPKDGEHHLTQVDDESSVGFMQHSEHGSEGEVIPAYHAYMVNINDTYRDNVDGFYFYEPIQKIDWTMETPSHGTLILPFDAALPAEFTAYRLTDISAARNMSLGTDDTETYQVITKQEVTEKAKDENGSDTELVQLKANTPYYITLNVAKSEKKAHRLAEDNSNPGATFSGNATNTEAEYKDGILTGVFVSRDDQVDGTKNSLEKGHVLTSSVDGPLFQTVEGRTAVPAYHAYINHESVTSPYLLFDEYTNEITWTMENSDFGTIVVPVEWTVPAGYEAYEVEGFEDVKEYNKGTSNFSYQVISQGSALGAIEANKPYLIMKKVATADTPATQAEAKVDGNGRLYEEFSWTADLNNSIPSDNGALVGTYSTVKSSEGDYIVTSSVDSAQGFIKERADVTVNAFHAYIPVSKVPDAPEYLIIGTLNKDITTGVIEIMDGDVTVDVFDLNGAVIARDVKAAEALRNLENGIYILRSTNATLKVIK